jgi:hypothetical protein
MIVHINLISKVFGLFMEGSYFIGSQIPITFIQLNYLNDEQMLTNKHITRTN